MHEVGVSEEPERAPPPLGGPAEERAAFHGGLSERPVPHLRARQGLLYPQPVGARAKQFQQSALADYIKRKTGKRPAGTSCGLQEPGRLLEPAGPTSSLRARASPRLPVSARFRSPACRARKTALLPATAVRALGRPSGPLRSSLASGLPWGKAAGTQRREDCSVELTVDQGPPG